jgi:hypothetical protein
MSLDTARWFDWLGTCGCGRRATGTLRDHRNDNLGAYCQRCAERAIKRADRLAEVERAITRAERLVDEQAGRS